MGGDARISRGEVLPPSPRHDPRVSLQGSLLQQPPGDADEGDDAQGGRAQCADEGAQAAGTVTHLVCSRVHPLCSFLRLGEDEVDQEGDHQGSDDLAFHETSRL